MPLRLIHNSRSMFDQGHTKSNKYCKTLKSYLEDIQLKFFPPVTDYMLRNGAEIWGVLLTEVSQSYLAGEAGAC